MPAKTIEQYAGEQKLSIYGAFEEAWKYAYRLKHNIDRVPNDNERHEILKNFNRYKQYSTRPKPAYVLAFENFISRQDAPAVMPQNVMDAVNRHFRT